MDEEDFVLEELQDQANTVGKLSPVEYARLRGFAPQRMFYYIKKGMVKVERCICGRKVVDVRTVDATLQEMAGKKRRRSGQPVLEPDEAESGEGSWPPVQGLPQESGMGSTEHRVREAGDGHHSSVDLLLWEDAS